MNNMKISRPASQRVFNILNYLFVGLFALICLVPFIILVSGSLSSEQAIRFSGYSLLPSDFSLEAYRVIFQYPEKVLSALGVSVGVTAVGTVLGLFITTMAAYVISRKDFPYRNMISFFFYFTTLFNGGMVCTYIFYIQYLGLKNNYAALVLPGLLNVFYLLIMRSFVSAIPMALIESAKIDGAGELRIYFQIILPMLKSGLATIGLFMALGYWNDWYNAMLYISESHMYPLQYMMYDMLMKNQALASIASKAGILIENLPTSSLKLAMAVVTTAPVVMLYPFVQRYFVKGVAIGAVKG